MMDETPVMVRYKIKITYDGTHFCGFQRQSAERTVQGVFEEALRRIGWLGGAVLAAGRTDTGVHAEGQVISFDMTWKHSTSDLRAALNANLPPDVAVKSVQVAEPGFHPRFDALRRQYRYQIYYRSFRDPLRDRYSWRVWPSVDLLMLEQVAGYLIGKHDFKSFGTPPKQGQSSIRTVFDARWHAEDDMLFFEITANAFLYHMVRRLVSYQIEVGQGKNTPESVVPLLEGKRGKMVQGLAPPNGLYLAGVYY